MMKQQSVMAMPAVCFWSVICLCLLGIGIGSFFDLQISIALKNVTDLGTYFATFSPSLAYCLLPAGGTCLFVGLKKKGDAYKPLAWMLLIFSWFMAVYYSDNYFGAKVRTILGYTTEDYSLLPFVVEWLLWAVLYALVPVILTRLLDDSDPDKLIAVGAALLIASIAADAVMQCLKQVGSRPRYKYLLTLEDPLSGFRNWWQMMPGLAGSNDGFMSWPSGHMSIVGTVFALPLLTDCLKKRSTGKNMTAFIFACAFVVLCGYNRIHMTNHFLSDVCFGTLNSCLLTGVICSACLHAASSKEQL